MGTMNSSITALLQLGADAMDNLFDVIISSTASGTPEAGEQTGPAIRDQLRLRCKGFTPPHFSQKTYDIRYKTIKLKRPASIVEGDRVFDLSFRLDANYQVYKELLKWRAQTLVPNLGFAANGWDSSKDSLNFRSIKVVCPGAPIQADGTNWAVTGVTDGGELPVESGSITPVWEFDGVWIIDISEPSYKQEGGSPIEITAKFAFGEYSDPVMSLGAATAPSGGGGGGGADTNTQLSPGAALA